MNYEELFAAEWVDTQREPHPAFKGHVEGYRKFLNVAFRMQQRVGDERSHHA